MKNQIRNLAAFVLRSVEREQKAERYLRRVLEPALFQTAQAWLKVEKGWVRKVTALNSIVDGYFALVGFFETPDLEDLRLELQRKIEKKLGVGVVVTRGNPHVTFSTPLIELTEGDLRPPKEVAR